MSQPGVVRLLLPEQLMLLAFASWNGRLRVGLRLRPYLQVALAGAVLTELALRGQHRGRTAAGAHPHVPGPRHGVARRGAVP